MAKATRRTIDWESIPVVIEDDCEPNPQNPFSTVTAEQRDEALRELARTILLRRVDQIGTN